MKCKPKSFAYRLRISFIIVSVILLIPSLLMAQRADVIILDNGDRITGEIRRLERGVLEFKPSRSNGIYLVWSTIEYISSEYKFDLELETGERHIGTIGRAEEKGKLVVISDDSQITLDIISIVRMYPLSKKFWSRLSGYLDVGLNFQRAQKKVEWKLGGEVTYRVEKHVIKTSADSYFSQQEDVEGTTRNNVAVVYQRILKNRWAPIAMTTHEQNDQLNLDYRALIGGLIGRFLIQNNRNFLVTSVGLTGTREKYSDSTDIGYNSEALLSIWYESYKYISPELHFNAILNVFPSITSWGRVRTNFKARLSFEIFSDFFLSLDGFYNFDNSPPGTGGVKHDYGIDTAITWSFR